MKGNGHGEKLTRKQEQVIAAILTEPTLGAAARKCRISESTLCRWRRDAGFRAAYRAASRQGLEAALASLKLAATEAVDCLRRNLTCGYPATELRAATAILNLVVGALDRLDLEEEKPPTGEVNVYALLEKHFATLSPELRNEVAAVMLKISDARIDADIAKVDEERRKMLPDSESVPVAEAVAGGTPANLPNPVGGMPAPNPADAPAPATPHIGRVGRPAIVV